MKKVDLVTEFIRLDQFLKLNSICSSGSEAKYYILENDIIVNDVLEKRRGRKLYKDDIVFINGEKYLLV